MNAYEKLRIISNWTAEFKITPLPDGTVRARTRLNGINNLPYTVVFNSLDQCADVRFEMVKVRVYDLCQHIDSLKWDKRII